MIFNPEDLSKFPTSFGVYIMKDAKETVLYVGKAKNLRQRLKQYFNPSGDARAIIPYLTAQIATIDFILVFSEKEALILENNLIKKHWPRYNVLLKDDKSFFSLAINSKHPWPMLRIVRFKGKPPAGQLYFGPYTNAFAARQTLDLLRELFPLRQCSDHELINRSRPCILYEMKRCVAPCVQRCTKEEYATLVDNVIDFLRGHDVSLLKKLKAEMEKASELLEFERAKHLYELIQSVEKTLEKQRVEKAGSKDLDVIGLYREGDHVSLVQMLFREGKLTALNEHHFQGTIQDDEEIISSFILQGYPEQPFLPEEILIPYEMKDREDLSALLSEGRKRKVEILYPQKGDKKALLEMAERNAQAKFTQERRAADVKEKILVTLEEELKLTHFPQVIECFDNSNLSGDEPVSAMVVFTNGARDPKRYRTYKIKTAGPSDDYGALKEVLTRRYAKAKQEDNLPDLIVIDGGKGHLNLALTVLASLDVSTVDVIAVAKEESKHTKGITLERVFTEWSDEPLVFKANAPLLFFLQKVRDEAHRVAINFQRKRRGKKTFKSQLDATVGIGPIKKERLLKHFGSLKRILEASEEELLAVKGINRKDAAALKLLKKQEK